MTTLIKTITKISSAIIFSLIIFSSAFASEISSQIDVNGSMYKYSAIENNSIYPDLMAINTEVSPIVEIGNLPVDTRTELADISEKKEFSIERINTIMTRINKSSGLKNFIIGNNFGELKFQLVQIKNYIFQFNDMLKMTENGPNITQMDDINAQIKLLEEERVKIENFVLIQEKKFSMFRWLITAL